MRRRRSIKRKNKRNDLITPQYTDELVSIYDIWIPLDFRMTTPQQRKIIKACNYLNENNGFDKPITVIAETNEKGHKNKLVLVDGYTRYLAALYNGIKTVPVMYVNIAEYTR